MPSENCHWKEPGQSLVSSTFMQIFSLGIHCPFQHYVLTSATLTSPGTLHFRKMSWVFIPWFPEISWSPNANFIILDSTHFKPASVISHKYTNNEVSSYQTHFAMFSWELVGQKLRTCLQTFFHFPITTFHTMHPHSY